MQRATSLLGATVGFAWSALAQVAHRSILKRPWAASEEARAKPPGPGGRGGRHWLALLLLLDLVAGFGSASLALAGESEPARPTPNAANWPGEAEAVPAETELIVRLYYGDRDRLGQLVSRYDVFEFANHAEGYVAARLHPAEYAELTQAGYRLEIDESRTALANRRLARPLTQYMGIPGYPCYRTVEETYATLAELAASHPGLASLVVIGESWDKLTSGGRAGYDLLVLVLSNKSRPGPKPRFFLMAEHHARELTTAETATRFAEELVTQYGVDPEVTWLLDYYEVHILPMANPDGRKWAEQGYWWRKNTDSDDGCTRLSSYGTDLNRNCGFHWGGAGSSSDPCNEVYHGPAAASEPENQAIQSYVRSLFPEQRGPNDSDPAPTNATGLLVTLHSYSQLVLFPWGWTAAAAPNQAALQKLGLKFGFFNRYTVQASIQLYPTTGTVDDWAYGELGVAAYTFELGTDFFQGCTDFESGIYPSNRLALLYACKACRQPYLDPAGPEVLQASAAPVTNLVGALVSLTAVANAGRYAGTTPLPPIQNIAAARYSVDNPSWVPGVVTYPMTAADGSFNSPNEAVQAAMDTTGWLPARHTIFLEAKDAAGNWGVPSAVFVWSEPFKITGTVSTNGFLVQWPSVSNRFYTLWRTEDLRLPFSVLASNLPARPPRNTYTDEISGLGARFYRVRAEP
ncbi:MAG: M14 family zinc carboxypeptidase [Verrucomicrobiota bacterium]|jgi:murein tripeptide amidase MpaA